MSIDTLIHDLYTHNQYKNALFLCSHQQTNKYKLIKQIIEYKLDNHHRSIQFSTESYTSLFYRAQSYYVLGNTHKAISTLVSAKNAPSDTATNTVLDTLFLNKNLAVIEELLGEWSLSMGDMNSSVNHYFCALKLCPLLRTAFMRLFDERKDSSISAETYMKTRKVFDVKKEEGIEQSFRKQFEGSFNIPLFNKENDFGLAEKRIKNGYCGDEELKKYSEPEKIKNSVGDSNTKKGVFNRNKCKNIKHDSSTEKIVADYKNDLLLPPTQDIVQKYENMVPGIGSYFLTDLAVVLLEEGKLGEAANLFEFVLKGDKEFTNNIEFYSFILYRLRETEKLGSLCRSLLNYNYEASMTWVCLGNYYNLIEEYEKSLHCLKKGLNVNNNYYTLAFIGYNYLERNDCDSALLYFNRSLILCTRNIYALTGIGIVYFKEALVEIGTAYLKKAVEISPNNLYVKYTLIKEAMFYEQYIVAMKAIEESFNYYNNGGGIKNRARLLFFHLSTIGGSFCPLKELIISEFCKLLIALKFGELANMLNEVLKLTK